MVGRQASRRLVMATDAAASALGLHVGMTASKAQALVSNLVVEDLRPDDDRRELERLALWLLGNYAPVVAVDPPDGLVIDTTGADHLHGNETLMITGIVNRLHGIGFSARVAIADTWGAAHALARWRANPHLVAPPGEVAIAMLDLPITSLRLDANTVRSLNALGFDKVGDLEATPRAPLALRFGSEVGRRLDQAFGRLSEPIVPIRPPDIVEVRRAFPEPISAAETISRYIRKLVKRICSDLELRGLGVRRLDLFCHRVDGDVQIIRAGTAKPVRDAERLSRLLCDRIEAIDPGFGIEIMVLTASCVEPLEAVQSSSALIEAPEANVGGLVDVIANRGHRIYRIAAVESDVPERSFQLIPPLADDAEGEWNLDWPRPSRLFLHPEPIQCLALLPDHPPANFVWRGMRHVVKRADGPERVFGEWWRRDRELVAVRDYFSVENEAGERFWIYRQGDGEHADSGSGGWFIHGIFA